MKLIELILFINATLAFFLGSDDSAPSDLVTKFSYFAQIIGTSGCLKLYKTNSFDCGDICGGDLKGIMVIDSVLDEETQGAGYVGFLHTKSKKVIYAAFRGTRTMTSALLDLQMLKSELDFNSNDYNDPNVLIHKGFEATYASLRDRIQNVLKILADKHPCSEIIFIGHSLGGAVANLAAFDFSNRNNHTYDKRVSVFTYGQPRVGNLDYHNRLQELDYSKRYYRVIQTGDPIPQMPSRSFGYVHSGIPFRIGANNEVKKCPIDGPGTESSQCYSSFFKQNIKDHLTDVGYFQKGLLKCSE